MCFVKLPSGTVVTEYSHQQHLKLPSFPIGMFILFLLICKSSCYALDIRSPSTTHIENMDLKLLKVKVCDL